MAALAATPLVVLSGAGLLCRWIGSYEDGSLLVGARLVGAGGALYRDFDTQDGPLGYTLLAGPLRSLGNPGLTLRLAQTVALIGLTILLFAALRRTGARASVVGSLGAVLVLSAALAQASFIGFGLTAAAVAVYAAGRAMGGSRTVFTPIAAAALLAASFWTRPGFAVSAAAALSFLELAAVSPGSRKRTALLLAAACGWVVVLYLLFFAPMSLRAFAEGALLAPLRLALGGHGRTPAWEAPRADLRVALLAAGLAAVPLVWAWTLRSRGGRLAIAAGIACGAGLALAVARGGEWPGLALTGLSLAANVLLVLLHRGTLRVSTRLWAAAAFGLCASALGVSQRFWSRPDPQHLFQWLALASASALLAWEGFRLPQRLAVVALFAAVFLRLGSAQAGAPIVSLSGGGLARVRQLASRPEATLLTIWPAGEVPASAAAAVSLSDRLSSPASRFVAYGTSQRGGLSEGDPVFLFLISRRLPYTRWFRHDPGERDPAAAREVQEEMIRELAASGSSTAVVWRSQAPAPGSTTPGPAARSAFDEAADRAYARVLGRFGSYEVRIPGASDSSDSSP